MEPVNAEIKVSPTRGEGYVKIDGIDLSDKIGGFTVHAEPGVPPILTLHLPAYITYEGPSLPQTIVPNNETVSALRQLDPDELEKEALLSSGMGDKMVPKLLELIVERVTQHGAATGPNS